MADGFVLLPGQGRSITLGAQHITFKVTGKHAQSASSFEAIVPAGFDVGAHIHAHSEELFYVLDGELEMFAFEPIVRTAADWQLWESPTGDRVTRLGPGGLMFVPPGCPHAFANPGTTPARMFFQSAPPAALERYLEELWDIPDAGGPPDPAFVEALRRRYDIEQLTPLKLGYSHG